MKARPFKTLVSKQSVVGVGGDVGFRTFWSFWLHFLPFSNIAKMAIIALLSKCHRYNQSQDYFTQLLGRFVGRNPENILVFLIKMQITSQPKQNLPWVLEVLVRLHYVAFEKCLKQHRTLALRGFLRWKYNYVAAL